VELEASSNVEKGYLLACKALHPALEAAAVTVLTSTFHLPHASKSAQARHQQGAHVQTADAVLYTGEGVELTAMWQSVRKLVCERG
jgi:hypothetical protein